MSDNLCASFPYDFRPCIAGRCRARIAGRGSYVDALDLSFLQLALEAPAQPPTLTHPRAPPAPAGSAGRWIARSCLCEMRNRNVPLSRKRARRRVAVPGTPIIPAFQIDERDALVLVMGP